MSPDTLTANGRRRGITLIILGALLVPVVIDQATERHSCHDRQATRQAQIRGADNLIRSAESLERDSDSARERAFWRGELPKRQAARAKLHEIDCPAVPMVGYF